MSIYPPDFNYDFTFRDVFLGFWINGYFPVFPWLVFPLIGFGIGNWLMAESGEKKNRHLRLLLLGLILIVFSIVGTFINSNFKSADIVSWYASELEFYPATTTFVLGSLGITIVFFWVLHRLFDFRQASGDWLIFFRRYSRFSLTTYVIHHAIHLWPLWLAGILLHNEKMYYYANITTPIIGLILAVAFIIFFYIVLIFWDRSKYKYSLEWIQYRFIE
jgi:uncharacterized membrane protein